ncbi:MAG TPA: PadR family transcriptional regulator [Acidimicrobiia bacterium]|nr:PadR family transcriptional regulator [Acidimicrobiia bacterium]
MDHNSQLLKGVLDMCLLSLIAEEPSYGYEMAAKLKDRGLRLVSDGSIYPTLSRLQKAGLVDGYFVEADGSGPPRKYYRIVGAGEDRLAEWSKEWLGLSSGVSTILNGGEHD